MWTETTRGAYVVSPPRPGAAAPWTLDAGGEASTAALGPDYADANLRFVSRAIRRLARGHCAGEPAGRVD